MMTNFQNVDEYGRREFIAHAAKACLGVGLMPMAGSYIHDSVKALTPGARPAAARHVIYLNMTGAMSHLDTFARKSIIQNSCMMLKRSQPVLMGLF